MEGKRKCRGVFQDFGPLGFKQKKINVHCIDLAHCHGVAGGRAVPPDVREEPGGALTSILHKLLSLSYRRVGI